MSFLVICLKNLTFYSIHTCSAMFIAALVTIAWRGKELKCPSAKEWLMKMWYMLYKMRSYSAVKKTEIKKIRKQMDEPRKKFY